MLIVRAGVGKAHMRRPFAPYLSLGIFPEPFDQLKKLDDLSWWRSRFGFFPGMAWGSEEPPACGGASVFVPDVW